MRSRRSMSHVRLAVVRPRAAAEVAAVVKACSSRGIPICPPGCRVRYDRGGQRSGRRRVPGATWMNDIVVIDTEARVAVVQPGVITLDLKKAVAAEGLFYAPDPTSSDWCTIGGNPSKGSNGPCGPCGSKYGVTADAVRGFELALAPGEILRTGPPHREGVTGHDLSRHVTWRHRIRRARDRSLKKSQLSDEIGPIGMAVHRAIKTALDEHGIFNPGSMFSLDPGHVRGRSAEAGFDLDTRHAPSRQS